jgi:lysozyme family protein
MDRFDIYIERVLSHEAGYVNHPNDPGGETKWGISKRSYPHLNIKDLTRAQAIEIYRKDFWMPLFDAYLHTAVAYQVLDSAVNHGMGNTRRFLQRAVDVADDGILGKITLAALRSADVNDLLMNFLAERIEFMTKLSTWISFGKGWMRRIAQNLRYATEDNDQ